jgi:hypothetical protein
VLFILMSLLAAFAIVRLAGAPSYTDAYYHFSAAERLVRGEGLTVPYLWTYIGAPDAFPPDGAIPSHTYWMPMTSLSAALGMWMFNAAGDPAAAQWPLTLMLAGTAWIAYLLGWKFGGRRRHAWSAGILTLASPFYLRWWGTIDTFAPYAFFGALALLAIGFASERRSTRWFALAGALSALCHLTRADGLLMLVTACAAACWPEKGMAPSSPTPSPTRGEGARAEEMNHRAHRAEEINHAVTEESERSGEAAVTARTITRTSLFTRIQWLAVVLAAYLFVMLPWFARNQFAVGSALPVGGTQAIWFREYDELFSYPPDASPQTLLADGTDALISSRWYGLINGLQTFVAVEGVIFLTPLMLVGLWRRRTDFTRGFWVYALGVHLAMTLVFPFPGARGGLFHSATALVPWWMAFGVSGLDDVLAWAVKRRRRWRLQTATTVFGAALVVFTVGFAAMMAASARPTAVSPLYAAVREALPPDARVMSADPAALDYYAGLGGVVQPNEAPETILTLAERYGVTHLLVEGRNVPFPLRSIIDAPPDFLIPVTLPTEGGSLYAIRR